MPNMLMMRPGDGNETAGAYKVAVLNSNGQNKAGIKRPTTLALSRQGMPNMDTTSMEGVAKGAYIVHGADVSNPDVIIVGTGSELMTAVEAGKILEGEGKKVRVVSMPCWELFEEQEKSYQDSVLIPGVPKVSIEAGSTQGWHKYVDLPVGVDEFGASAPAPILAEKYGLTADAVVKAAKSLL